MSEFIEGLRLSELFYHEAVAPILAAEFPRLRYSAALIGYGSEILGYDTVRSTDHEWGPRLLLFLPDDAAGPLATEIGAALSRRLPPTFRGYSTHFGPPDAEGVRLPAERESGPVNHKVEVYKVGAFFEAWIGLDPRRDLAPADWLSLPQQKLLEVTAGRVYHDGLGTLEPIRSRLHFYPRDVWLYLLAAQWRRIEQQEAFVGRAGEVGDELGSTLIGAGLVRDLMRLCFLMERRYAPYSKWFGTAFARLASAPELTPVLDRVLRATTWPEREVHLSTAYEIVARMHNGLGITPPLEARVSPFHGRPFRVIHAGRFVAAIAAAIEDPAVKAIPGWFGAIDQITDNTDVLTRPKTYQQLTTIYA